MYSEKTYKNYIFWMQVKRVVVILVLSCLGAALGMLIGWILGSTMKLTSFNNIIIAVSTTVFFLLGVLLTVGTGKQVQDGYWRIAVLRKLTVIQKNLELNNELLRNTDKSIKDNLSPVGNMNTEIKEEEVTTEEEFDATALYKFDETALVPQNQKKLAKMKKKKIKKPEDLK
ncbi:MAG: hypothetical protein IJ629_03240 [Clostridia bacterium]|nr:hypothetical protein [Clostridia bacterium]